MFIQPVSTVSFTTLLHIIAELFTTIYIDKKALFFNQNEENKITGKVSTRLQFFGSFPWLSIIPIISHIPVFFMDMNFFTRTPNIDQNILGSFRNASGTTFLNLGSLGVTPYSLAMLLFETYLKINFFVRILYTQFGELSSSRSTNFIIKLTGAISMMSAGYINVALIEPTCLNYDACLVANNIYLKNKNIIYAFGHHHLGWTLGAITGKIVSGIVAEEKTNLDLAPYNSSRFN